ncbi:hypothetical protein FHL15_005069 [Xylaria flabelliformis]|uniref:Xanthine/uracil permease n=1 Tax=Xylaria flabelliformis TaxID=2512241 RepID=A0A553I1C5_9PEZI|nr:hypothetical protein FHL15_005069 [Xylaria flabelliformis]
MITAKTINEKVARSAVGRWFKLDGCGHPKARKGSLFLTEIRAGVVAFFAMAYILAVNASILSDSGAPGLGLNAYFAYNVVGFHGSGTTPYRIALTATFVEGFVFFGLAFFGLRQWLARAIPRSIKLATSVGIGLFLTIIGFTYSEGLGILQGATSTPLVLAGCPQTGFGDDGLCTEATKMRNPAMWVGIFAGGVLTVMLLMYRFKAAIVTGILLVSIISWPRTTALTYFPYTETGNDAFDFFRKVVDFHQISRTLNVQQWDISQHGGQFGLALITFLYVDVLDTTGTLYAMARLANVIDPETGDFEGSTAAYMVDALSISIGSLFGCSPVTAFIESGAGISDGGRTGLTAMTTGICFFISVFFAPIFASIPPWATGCVLILVGSMMMPAATEINWRYLGDAIPAFITIVVMPFTYSIAYGLIAGILLYIIINTLVWLIEIASGGRLVPANKSEKDAWTWRIPGGALPPWMGRAMRGKKDFWRDDSYNVSESTSSEGVAVDDKRSSSPSIRGEPTDISASNEKHA